MKLFLLIFVVISSVSAVPFNWHAYSTWRYPDTCCQLEWTAMSQGDPLPADYIPAGVFMNRSWAFADFWAEWKSDQKGNWKLLYVY